MFDHLTWQCFAAGMARDQRVDFGSLDVARRRELVEVVAAHRAEAPDEVLSAHGMLSDRITRARAAYGA